jgi:hypothetical protein
MLLWPLEHASLCEKDHGTRGLCPVILMEAELLMAVSAFAGVLVYIIVTSIGTTRMQCLALTEWIRRSG